MNILLAPTMWGGVIALILLQGGGTPGELTADKAFDAIVTVVDNRAGHLWDSCCN